MADHNNTSTRRGEIILEGQAIRQRWPVPDEGKRLLMAQLFKDALGHPDERARAAAARNILAADALNLAQERLDFEKMRYAHDQEMQRRLGALEESIRAEFESVQRGSDGDTGEVAVSTSGGTSLESPPAGNGEVPG